MTELSMFPFDKLPNLDKQGEYNDGRRQKLAVEAVTFFTNSREYLTSLPVNSSWGDFRKLKVGVGDAVVNWRLDDPDNLAHNPDGLGRWEEVLSVRSLDWSDYASLELTVNRFTVGSINFDNNTKSEGVGGYTGADIELRATDTNGQDQLTADYSGLIGGWYAKKSVDGAPGRQDALETDPNFDFSAYLDRIRPVEIDLSTDRPAYQRLTVAAEKLSEILDKIKRQAL